MKILVLGRNSSSSKLLVNTLLQHNYETFFIQEQRDDSLQLIKNRVKRKGFFTVVFQLTFQVFQRILVSFSKRRTRELINGRDQELAPVAVYENINSGEAIDAVSAVGADLIILSGTRILSPNFLKKVTQPIVNIHAGITPKYRGVHGGYWALVNGEPALFGSTIHRVDEGIDTGEVIRYAFATPSNRDNFVTYPILQQRAACDEIVKLLKSGKLFEVAEESVTEQSLLWSHPTIFEYLYYVVTRGIK
ncbi:formyl transferase [Shewanella glacialipiscicola]|uniref:formyl transferase n=1 Tax=Shewanella glacialipiscicola TaxID=614069 RepID=UPI0021D9A58B|nr:formyl transferase [Shewanella glacialipiscicola]MCU7995603.1 formyl transferase [Shewanella glacialipiscicola]MCU8026850.1 formyl transferase [Shewanella glacialipiscicola]